MSLSKALSLREAKLKQHDLEADTASVAPALDADSTEAEANSRAPSKGKGKAKEMNGEASISSAADEKKRRQTTKKATAEPKVNGASAMLPPPPRPDRPVRERKPRTPSAAGFTPLTERERESVERQASEVSDSVSTAAAAGGSGGQQQSRVASVGVNRIRIRGPRISGSPYPSPHPTGEANGESSVSQGRESRAQAARKVSKRAGSRSGEGANGDGLGRTSVTTEDGVTFAPLGATHPPLWSRKPLPPYSSANIASSSAPEAAGDRRELKDMANGAAGMEELWPSDRPTEDDKREPESSKSLREDAGATTKAELAYHTGRRRYVSPSETHQVRETSPGSSTVRARYYVHHTLDIPDSHNHPHVHNRVDTHGNAVTNERHHGHYPPHVHAQTQQPPKRDTGHGDAEAVVNGSSRQSRAESDLPVNFREAFAPNVPNPGRTIYSQMR
jgi:hypothetical protein